MHQLLPHQDSSAGARSGIAKRDLIRKARPGANGHRHKADAGHLFPDGRAISAMGQEEGQMSTASADLARRRYEELAYLPRGGLITAGDSGHNRAPGSLSQPC